MQSTAAEHQPSRSARSQFWGGLRAMLPLLLAVFPFGAIYGVLAVNAGLSLAASQAMSFLVFAGSAQFVTTQLIASGVPALVVILTILVVNLRHALYSASMAPYVKKLSPAWKALLAYLLTDEAYVVAITHYNEEGSQGNQQWFFLGAGLGLWSCWQLSTACGVFLGAQIPASWSLDFALPLIFIALVFPALKDAASVMAALSAGGVALLAYNMPFRLGIITAAVVGIIVGLLVEELQARRKKERVRE